MILSEPCLVCRGVKCDCHQSLVRFFEILESASNKPVLRVISASALDKNLTSVGIDKLNGAFATPIERKLLNLSNLNSRKVFLRDRRKYLEVKSAGNCTIHLKLSPDEQTITSFVSNPNQFGNWSSLIQFLQSVLSNEAIENAIITRVDLNLDFQCPFQKLLQNIDIKIKRSALSFVDVSGHRTGANIGKGSEIVVVYDRSEHLQIEKELSRIELRLQKSKLPTRKIYDLPEVLTQKSFFTTLVGQDVEVLTTPDSEKTNRITEFNHLWKREGFYSAKKFFNTQRNFDRDFSSLLKITKWERQPTDLFKQEIQKFFNNKEEEKWIPKTSVH